MKPEVEQCLDHFSKRIYDIQFVKMPESTKKKAIDIDARLCSDVLSCDSAYATHTTEWVLANCIWWSKNAQEYFWDEQIYNKDKTEARTVRQRRKGYVKNGSRRVFTVEHEYPLGILKSKVINKQFESVDDVKKYLKKYNKVTVITHEENNELRWKGLNSATTIEEAVDRYKICGIDVVKFSENRQIIF